MAEGPAAHLLAEGRAALVRNDIDATIVAWRQYVAAVPVDAPEAKLIRGYLTLLGREGAKRYVARAVAREKSGEFIPTDRNHVAVFPFENQGPSSNRPANSFNRALVAMVVTDLAQVPSLKVLERDKIEQLMQEFRLSESGLMDTATAARRGRILGAGTAVAGTVYNEAGPTGPDSGRYKIDAAVSEVGGSMLSLVEADGTQSEFFLQEKQIVHGILAALDVHDIPASVDRIHTRSWQAYAQFAVGLQMLAENRFDEARQAFAKALQFDPGFDLAHEALLDTPERAATLEEIENRMVTANPG